MRSRQNFSGITGRVCFPTRFFLAVFSILAVLLQNSAFSRDIYVDNVRGNDEFTGWEMRIGSSGTGPVKTIGRALKLAQSGDHIVLAHNEGEPYRESVTFLGKNHSAANARFFTLEGNGATLDGSEEFDPALWKYFRDGIFRFKPRLMAYQNLFLDGKPLQRVVLPKVEIPVVALDEMQWCLHEGYVYFKPERERLPDEYPLRIAGLECGITLMHVQGVCIQNLVVQGFQHDGISAANAARHVNLKNVTLRGNARAGLSVGGASRVWVIESLLGNNNFAQLLLEKHSSVRLIDTDLLANTAPAWVDRGLEEDQKVSTSEIILGDKPVSPEPAIREAFRREMEAKTAAAVKAEAEKEPAADAGDDLNLAPNAEDAGDGDDEDDEDF